MVCTSELISRYVTRENGVVVRVSEFRTPFSKREDFHVPIGGPYEVWVTFGLGPATIRTIGQEYAERIRKQYKDAGDF